MKKLVVAEKPSLSRKIIAALEFAGEDFSKKDEGEYFESDNYVVTSQFGHILELKDISNYKENEEKDMWKIENLPFFPKRYEYVIKEDCEQRFDTIKTLVGRADIDEILNCGDPGREGQLLIDETLEYIGCTKFVSRPWLKTTTKEAILSAIDTRKPNTDYINLHNEGLVRAFLDQDFGINLSRYAIAKAGKGSALNIGRVKGAIVTEIYNRDMEIKNFVAREYYKIESNLNGIKLSSDLEFELNEYENAVKVANYYNSVGTTVKSIEKKKVTKGSPKLFSQTSLQAKMNKAHGYSPDETLSLTQSLYEKGFVSYPRTNSEYMTNDEKDDVKEIIDSKSKGELIFKDSKRIFDSSKVEDHSAIIPTRLTATGLSEDEQNCYNIILNRFKAVFCAEPCEYFQTNVVFATGDLEEFKVRSETPITLGWQKYDLPDKSDEDEKTLPDLTEGQVVKTDFKPIKTKTQPPKHYTVESLGKWMQNPFKKEKDTEEEEYRNILAGLEIGTEATRAVILKVLTDKKYISLKKSSYYVEPNGEYLVEVSRQLGIDMSKNKTAQMGKLTKDVGRGEKTIDEILSSERAEIKDIIAADRPVTVSGGEPETKSLGECPLCGKDVAEKKTKDGKIFYGCSGYKDGCRFTIWKNNPLLARYKKSVTPGMVKLWLSGKPCELKNLTAKNGNKYNILVYFDGMEENGKGYLNPKFRTEFPEKKKSK